MKLFRYGLAVFLCSLLIGVSRAAFSYNDFVAQFTKASVGMSLPQKKTYYTKIYNNLSLLAIRNREDSTQYTLYTSLKTYIYSQLKALGTGSASVPASTSTSTYSDSWMSIPKVDLARVRDTWLSLHNTERATKKLTPFTYNPSLEQTATTRANHLAQLGKATHQRKSTDGYYSYASIKQRFIDQGITFLNKEKNGQALFTENLWRWYYTCKKTDCTDDLIKAIKTTRSFFMSEKGKSYRPHYNAIAGNFSHIGLWIGFSNGKYYLVTHYTQALK